MDFGFDSQKPKIYIRTVKYSGKIVMDNLRTIKIDIDVHKAIEAERESFDEGPNEILRRVLGLGPTGASVPPKMLPGDAGRAWTGKGVTLPHGSLARFEYNGRWHEGRIDNSEWLVHGSRYKSPSAAACGAARTRSGSQPSLNGWIYWEVRRPDDKVWVRLDSLKPKVQSVSLADF